MEDEKQDAEDDVGKKIQIQDFKCDDAALEGQNCASQLEKRTLTSKGRKENQKDKKITDNCKDWISWVTKDAERYELLVFNESGTITVPIKAISLCGIEHRKFADELLALGIVTNKN